MFDPAEFAMLQTSIANMVTALDNAAHQSSDPSPRTSVLIAAPRHTGKSGHPHHKVNPEFLAATIKVRQLTKIALVVGCSPRTLCHRLLDYHLAQAGISPITIDQSIDGGARQVHHIQPASANQLTNAELDAYISKTLQNYPTLDVP